MLVGGGPVASGKLESLVAAGARVRVVAPEVTEAIERAAVADALVTPAQVIIARRPFAPSDLDGAWLVVAAATPAVNREVAVAAEARRLFVNAVDDPPNASAFLGGVVRRDGVTVAISTSGAAPALAALLRQAIDAVLPKDLVAWMAEARRQRLVWRRDRVPMEARKPLLLRALNGLYGESSLSPTCPELRGEPLALSPSSGHVSLVGAGPGDPGLLTRRALGRLRAADLVLYDALIDDRILRYARKAQRFFVGKRAGRQALAQEAIHAVMIRAARRGRRVVRLKGGDPFVFGRGGEEMLALQEAGISFDVVPGVTSALAAPALAGIPLTHRRVASAFLVVSGHDVAAFAEATSQARPGGTTLVVLMGLGRCAELANILMGQGWAAQTPSAVVFDASRADQQVWCGTLEDVGSVQGGGEGPATIVIGDVVTLATAHRCEELGERMYVHSR